MGKNGLPDDVLQSDYEQYVKDMENEPEYEPDDETLVDMQREHMTTQQVFALEKQVFNKSYIDSVLLDETQEGGLNRSSLMDLAGASGLLEVNKASWLGARAQSGLSYYAMQKLDAINKAADEAGDDGFYVKRDAFKALYADYKKLDFEVNCTQVARTSVLTEGAAMLLEKEMGRDGKDLPDKIYGGVHYPSVMRQICGEGPWQGNMPMVDYIDEAIKNGHTFDAQPAYKMALQDRFLQLMPGALRDDSEKNVLFNEMADVFDAIQSPAAASLGVVIERNEPQAVTEALLGYTANKHLYDMGFGDYLKQREAGRDLAVKEPVNNREIKNAPDFKENDGVERSDEYES